MEQRKWNYKPLLYPELTRLHGRASSVTARSRGIGREIPQ